jgi:hypothetical protein
MVAVLNQMEILNQQVMAVGTIRQQLADLFDRFEVDLPPFREGSRALAGTDMSGGSIWATIQRDFFFGPIAVRFQNLAHAFFATWR